MGQFNFEETNLICCYRRKTRADTVAAMTAALPYMETEEQPKDPAALQGVLRDEKHSRERLKSGDIKEHIETLSGKGKEKNPSLRAQLAQDKKTVNAAPKESKTVQRTVAKNKNKGLEV